MPITSLKVTIGSTPTLIYKVIPGVTIARLIIQTPQGAFFVGPIGVSVASGFPMNSITSVLPIQLGAGDSIYGITNPNETAFAYVLVVT